MNAFEEARVSTDVGWMRSVAKHGAIELKLGIIENPLAPDDVIEGLARDRDATVAAAATSRIRNPAAREELKALVAERAPAVARSLSVPASMVDSSVSAATGAADSLKLIAGILGTLGVVGGVILAVFGLVPQCPAGDSYCSDYDKSVNIVLFASGVVGALFWLWVYAISNAVAARVRLAAAVAASQTSRLE